LFSVANLRRITRLELVENATNCVNTENPLLDLLLFHLLLYITSRG
jgi:hypothetical protein